MGSNPRVRFPKNMVFREAMTLELNFAIWACFYCTLGVVALILFVVYFGDFVKIMLRRE
jgi:hypothetical protein